MQNQNFGIMDEGYFVAKGEILSWINNLLSLNITKIEQLGAGSVYCQIVDVVHPGKVQLTKINWKAKNDYQFIANYKILQTAFEKIGIKRYVEVEKLVKAKYQDNLEFIQWLKRYFDVNCGEKGQQYNAEEKRAGVLPDFSFADKVVVPKSYNATGQVVPKSKIGSKEKKQVAGSSSQQKQSAKRLSSPQIIQKREEAKIKTPTNNSKEKRQSQIEQKNSSKDHKGGQQIQRSKLQKEELIRPIKSVNVEEIEKYKKIIRDLQVKIDMITEIATSSDESDLKIQLIEEVLKIKKDSIIEDKQEYNKKPDIPKPRSNHQMNKDNSIKTSPKIDQSQEETITFEKQQSIMQSSEFHQVKPLKTTESKEEQEVEQAEVQEAIDEDAF